MKKINIAVIGLLRPGIARLPRFTIEDIMRTTYDPGLFFDDDDRVCVVRGGIDIFLTELTADATGYLIQDENPFINPVLFSCPPRPVWMAMAGPKDSSKLERVTWHFILRSGHEEEPRNEHLEARCTGPMTSGRKLCFLTVFAPQPKGSTTIPKNVHVEVNGGRAIGTVGDWEFQFGPTKLNRAGTEGKVARFAATLKASYRATENTEEDLPEFSSPCLCVSVRDLPSELVWSPIFRGKMIFRQSATTCQRRRRTRAKDAKDAKVDQTTILSSSWRAWRPLREPFGCGFAALCFWLELILNSGFVQILSI